MCSELPKEFEKSTEVLPFTKYGLSTIQDFQKAENDVQHLEWLKKVGLSNEEVKLYQDNEAGLLDQRNKIESGALKARLDELYNKIKKYQTAGSSEQSNTDAGTSNNKKDETPERVPKKCLKFYHEGHPMNEIKEIEEDLFGHLRHDNILPITKRRKLLRRLERKKERIMYLQNQLRTFPTQSTNLTPSKPGSLWDLKELPKSVRPECSTSRAKIFGPQEGHKMYTIKDKKILRMEPVPRNNVDDLEFRADIAMPVNPAEEQLLEGTKMCLDDIKKIDRFKDYEPGLPSKVLFLKNISPIVSEQQLSLLFNQFLLDNGGPIDVRVLTGRMRGQAFVTFNTEDLAIKALDEVNGTILSGRPIIAQFGRNSNRIQDDNR